ncbi:MAG TPA: hypothetical protein VGL89_01980 [Candidatus Koribacter sp.]
MQIPLAKQRRRTSGVSIYLLQRHLERFTDAQLDAAMQAAWHKEYDPQEFFSVSIPQEHGAIIHAFGAEIDVSHFDYAMGWNRLGDDPLPFWAEHSGFTSLNYRCGNEPPPDRRVQMYRGLAMLAAELATDHTAGFLFPLERVLLPNSSAVQVAFQAKGPLDPQDLTVLAE